MNRHLGQRIGRSIFRSRPHRRAKVLRPIIEPLENRQLLSTVDWISAASGSWDVASNWSTDVGQPYCLL